jgi:hypothetical protein
MQWSDVPGPERAAERRPVLGLVVGLATLLGLAVPVVALASLAHTGFSGCWIACGGAPNPALGIVGTLAAAAVLATAPAVGLIVARVRSPRVWTVVALAVAGAAVAWVFFSLDPDTAEFFVRLGEDA